MAHFAEIGLNNTVIRVIVVNNAELIDENGQESEAKGQAFCRNLLGGTWLQTSYNATFRRHYAGAGYTYDSQRDAFIPPKPFDSWTLDEATLTWQSPVPYPQISGACEWDETTLSWKEIPITIDASLIDPSVVDTSSTGSGASGTGA
jgi:hypothetical protein